MSASIALGDAARLARVSRTSTRSWFASATSDTATRSRSVRSISTAELRAVKLLQGEGAQTSLAGVFGEAILTPRAGRPIAPKGGTQTVAPRKGAIAAAIRATGRPVMAISREHGLNPSQMRRLSLDQVAKVDLVRAEAIATALGVKVADLFGEAHDKAKAVNGNGKAAG